MSRGDDPPHDPVHQMILDPATVLALAVRCAPAAAPETLLAVVHAESGLNPFAVGVNRGAPIRPPRSRADAIAAAQTLLARGANIDLGLGQINSRNLRRLGLSLEDAFDPCRNLAAAAGVLRAGYSRALPRAPDEQAALRTALSVYNTGDSERGVRNGYVARVEASARRLLGGPTAPRPTASEPRPARPSWDVFGETGRAAFVISPTTARPGDLN